MNRQDMLKRSYCTLPSLANPHWLLEQRDVRPRSCVRIDRRNAADSNVFAKSKRDKQLDLLTLSKSSIADFVHIQTLEHRLRRQLCGPKASVLARLCHTATHTKSSKCWKLHPVPFSGSAMAYSSSWANPSWR